MLTKFMLNMLPNTLANQFMASELIANQRPVALPAPCRNISELAKEHGVSNLIFSVPLSLFSDNELDYDSPMVDCVSQEGYNRKLEDGYKLTLVSIEDYMVNSFFGWSRRKLEREFYVMDFKGLMDRHPEFFKVRFTCTDVH